MSDRDRGLLIRLEANLAGLRAGLRQAEADLSRSTRTMQGDLRNLDRSFSQLKAAGMAFIASIGLQGLGTQVYEVNKSFMDLRAGLETATGSADKARIAFAQIKDLAKTTPYTLQEVTTAFIRLTNLGLDTSAESMTAWGDIAASIPGKSIMDWVEAVADASTGEFERLKEFGIKASAENEKVTITFKGASQTIKKDAADIEQYLLRLAQANFGGAMAKKMETLGGAASNLQDAIDALYVAIGEAGAITAMTAVIKTLTGGAKTLEDNLGGITDVAVLLAAVMLGRVTPSLLSSAAGATQYQRALIANIATMGRMGAASATGSRAMLGRSAATLTAAQSERDAAAATVARLSADKAMLASNATRIAQERALAADAVALQAGIRAATGQTAGYTAALSARNASTKALIVTQRALRVTTAELAIAETALGAASAKATEAEIAHAAALARTTLAARAAALAGRALNGVMALFGGPVGFAITAAATAVYFLATAQDEAAKAAEAHQKAIDQFDRAIDLGTGKLKEMSKELQALTLFRLEDAAAAKEAALAESRSGVGTSGAWGLLGQNITYGAEAASAVYDAGAAYKRMVAAGDPSALEAYVARLEEIKQISPDAAKAVNDEFSKLTAVQALNDDLRDIEARMAVIKGTATPEQKKSLGLDTGDAAAPPKAPVGDGKAGESAAKKIQTAIDGLQFERDQLTRSNREQAIYNALKQAGVEGATAQAQKVREVAGALFDEQEAHAAMIESMDREAQILADGKAMKDGLRTASEKYADQVQKINDLHAAGAIDSETYARALSEAKTELRNNSAELRELGEFGEDVFDKMGSALTDALSEGKSAFDALRSVGKSVLNDLMNEMLKLAITNPLKNAVFGYAGQQLLPTLGSAMGSMFTFADGGVMTGQGPLPLRKYSAGGIAKSAQVAVFGEGSTPEAFVPVPSGRIPVELRGMGSSGGGGGSLTVNVIDQRRAGTQDLQPQTRQDGGGLSVDVLVTDIVARDIKNGGPISSAMGSAYGVSRRGY